MRVKQRHRGRERDMADDEDHTLTEAKDYYSRSRWWSEKEQGLEDLKRRERNGVNGFYGYNSQEIVTPDVSVSLHSFEAIKNSISSTRIADTKEENYRDVASAGNGVDEIFKVSGEQIEETSEYGQYSMQVLSTEIVEIVEDGKSITSNKDRRDDDIYVAVGKDDLDVVQWVLDHVASPGSRIFLVHVSPPITLIPTPVGKFERCQLTPQQVRLYVNEENNKRKDLLQKYIQLSTEAKVTGETLLLESNDTGKAILDLISILNITNIVIGIKKLPYSRRSNKLSKGEYVKKNAPRSCEVTLVYNGEEFVLSPCMDRLAASNGLGSPSKGHSKSNFLNCMCLSGCMRD